MFWRVVRWFVITEGLCDLCHRTLLPAINTRTLERSDVLVCSHCDRPHQRTNCPVCDVVLAHAPPDIETETT